MDLSVIIVNWNTKDLLVNCLQSLVDSLTTTSREIYVVDNGSTDGSQSAVKSCFSEVKLIENGRNLGFARANNMALREAKGRFLLLLNSDTIVPRGAIEGLMQTMESDPFIGIGGLQLLNEDGSLQNSIYSFPSLVTELTNKSLLRRLFPAKYPGKEQNISKPVQVDGIIGSCMLVRREAMEQVGLLDEDYFFFFEETDWCLRMRKAGWKVVFDPAYSIWHLQGRSASTVNVRARIEYWRSRYTYFAKHFGMATRCALYAGLLVKLAVDIGLSSVVALGAPIFGGKRSARLKVYAAILLWHLRGCPSDGGLETSAG